MSKGENLEISNNVIRFRHESYQIRNIVRLGKFKTKVNYFGYLLLAFIVASVSLFIGQQRGIGGSAAIVGLVISIVIIFVMMLKKPRYMLRIETNSGSGELLESKKERVIDSLIDLISLVMNMDHGNVNYNIDMRDYSVKETIGGHKFSDIRGAVIATENAIAQRDGVNISGKVGRVGGDIAGRDTGRPG